MTRIQPVLIASFLFFGFRFLNSQHVKTESKFQNHYQLKLTQDSGFITKDSGLQFLLSNMLSNSSDAWSNVKQTDTIGKYYKYGMFDNFIICLIDKSERYIFENHLIAIVNKSGELIKSERFFHGNYPICWSNYYDGFNKYGEYYGINICGTGSGYYADYLCLFKEVHSQDSLTHIPIGYWSAFCEAEGLSESLSSTLTFNNKELSIHYIVERGVLSDSSDFVVKNKREFDVKFINIENIWITNDSLKFKGLQIRL